MEQIAMDQPAAPPLCLHCEKAPQANVFRLCQGCAACKGLRNIYRKRRKWTPQWDAHLQELVERAKKHLPLFVDGDERELPRRPYQPDRANRNRRQRTIIYHKIHLGEIA